MRLRSIWFVAVLLGACEHAAPFRPASYTPDGPLNPSPPIRLTFNPGVDFAPVWLPGGAEILYTAQRLDRADRDRCLAVLPAAGGPISRYICRSTASDDSTNVFEEAAPAADGRIAYVRVSTHRLPFRPLTPDDQALVLGTVDDPNAVRVLQPIAYTAPSGRQHQAMSHIQWLNAGKLVYLAEEVTYPRPCSSCAPDTVRTGLEIATLDFVGLAVPIIVVVPGTDSASSVAVGATGDTIYFTRINDPRVYRRAFSSGQTDTIHNFGGAIALDVAVANGRLVAVVGDQLHFVDLVTGAESVIADTLSRFRRPVFSADGRRVAVERWVNRAVDLWLLDVP
jgi:hypothetical protein